MYDTDIEGFLSKTCQAIKHRGRFMVAMLQIIELHPCYYQELVENVFDKDCVYNGYSEVIETIKKKSCYSVPKVKELIDKL